MDLAHEFPLRDNIIHLNHAAVSPWPRSTVEAVKSFAEENMVQGSQNYLLWIKAEQRLRKQFKQLLNAPSTDDIALVKNTSEGLSFVAYGLDWNSGDNIVTSDQEFPSNRIVWESLAEHGVSLRQADLDAYSSPEDALIAQMDERTRLLAISSVQYASGLRMDLKRLGEHCKAHNILFCVDAIQSLGAVEMDVQDICADFVIADGHKWMLGPEGLGVFFCGKELRKRLKLTQFGWHMVEAMGNYEQKEWSPASSARRFECGSPNMMTIHALSASLKLLLDYGIHNVESTLLAKTSMLHKHLADIPDIELLSSINNGRYAGIVTFRHTKIDSNELHHRLTQEGVICVPRGGGVRFSPHFYTPDSKLEHALELLKSSV